MQHMYITFVYATSNVCLVIVFFIGTNCKTEKVGIRVLELTFKQLFTDPETPEFKDLESSLLSAVSYLKHKCNVWDQVYTVCLEGSGVHITVKLNLNGDI